MISIPFFEINNFFNLLISFISFFISSYGHNTILYTSLFSRHKFSCFFQKSISWVLTFVGVILVVMNRVHMVLFILQLGVITKFITSIMRYGRLVMERKRKNFDPFIASVMKDKEIVHILK